MLRKVTPLALLFTSFTAIAQGPLGRLTVTAARSHGAHSPALEARGGAPYNDLCQNAVVQTLPPDGSVTITGDNTGATDTEDFGNPVSWEAFSTDTCATVTVAYCGTDPLFELVYSILIVGCPDFIANVQNSGTTYCDDGNVIITYESLPAGTYYVPVLLTAGAQGAYTMTITSDVCDTPPLNDICVNAQPLQVVQDCALGTVMGNNANAVINSAPPCAVTTSQFQDVWYQFDSGTDTSVVITLDPGTIGDIGVEVRDACAGSSVFCAVGDTSWTVEVVPGTTYRVRVFSNNDFGFGGTFGICVTRPTGTCDAGTVTLVGGGAAITACVNGDDPITFLQETAGGATLALVLTDAEDTIASLMAGNVLDPGTLQPGEYHVWGLAYDGDLMDVNAGQPLSGLSATGNCLDVSAAPVTVTIEICEGLPAQGTQSEDFVVISTQNGHFLRWNGTARPVAFELLDGRGALLIRKTFKAHPGMNVPIVSGAELPVGLYLVRVTGDGGPHVVKRVFVH